MARRPVHSWRSGHCSGPLAALHEHCPCWGNGRCWHHQMLEFYLQTAPEESKPVGDKSCINTPSFPQTQHNPFPTNTTQDQLSWMADSRRLRFRQWRTAVLPEALSAASRKLTAAFSCWGQAHISLSTNIQADDASAQRHMSEVHAVTLTALRRTTLSDPRWDIRGAAAQRMKRLRDENPPEMHKRRRIEALEVPSDLRDMEILLEDMGNVIVLTGL